MQKSQIKAYDIASRILKKISTVKIAMMKPKTVILDLNTYNELCNSLLECEIKFSISMPMRFRPVEILTPEQNRQVEMTDISGKLNCNEIKEIDKIFGLPVLVLRTDAEIIEVSI